MNLNVDFELGPWPQHQDTVIRRKDLFDIIDGELDEYFEV
jgi:hypothetical protein